MRKEKLRRKSNRKIDHEEMDDRETKEGDEGRKKRK